MLKVIDFMSYSKTYHLVGRSGGCNPLPSSSKAVLKVTDIMLLLLLVPVFKRYRKATGGRSFFISNKRGDSTVSPLPPPKFPISSPSVHLMCHHFLPYVTSPSHNYLYSLCFR